MLAWRRLDHSVTMVRKRTTTTLVNRDGTCSIRELTGYSNKERSSQLNHGILFLMHTLIEIKMLSSSQGRGGMDVKGLIESAMMTSTTAAQLAPMDLWVQLVLSAAIVVLVAVFGILLLVVVVVLLVAVVEAGPTVPAVAVAEAAAVVQDGVLIVYYRLRPTNMWTT